MATLDEIQPHRIALKSRVTLEKRAQASSQYLCGTEKPDSAHVIHELRVRDEHGNMRRLRALTDCGGTSIFMAPRLVRQLGLKHEPAFTSTQGLNGHVMVSAKESRKTSISVQYVEHLAPVDKPEVLIVPMKAYDLVLGLLWFMARNPEIDWSRGRLTGLKCPGGDGAIPEAEPISTLQSVDNVSDAKLLSEQCGEVRPLPSADIQILGATAFDNLPASDEVAETFFLLLGDCTGMLGATGERSHEQGEYPRRLDVRAGAAAVVAAD